MAIQPVSPFSTPPAKPVREKAQVAPHPATESAPPAGIAAAQASGRSAQAVQPSREQVDRAMNEVRRALDPVARNLQFSIDEETGRTVIKVVDALTKEVIRQIPSEELLELSRTLDGYSGLFVRQKA